MWKISLASMLYCAEVLDFGFGLGLKGIRCLVLWSGVFRFVTLLVYEITSFCILPLLSVIASS